MAYLSAPIGCLHINFDADKDGAFEAIAGAFIIDNTWRSEPFEGTLQEESSKADITDEEQPGLQVLSTDYDNYLITI